MNVNTCLFVSPAGGAKQGEACAKQARSYANEIFSVRRTGQTN